MSDTPITSDQVLSALCLDGHDSELFSFLDSAYIEQLRKHQSASVPLYTFGRTRDGKVSSVCVWNSSPSCFAWTVRPPVVEDRGWLNYCGFVTKESLIRLEALALVRLIWDQSYTCSLNGQRWIDHRGDPALQRLAYIRGYGEHSTDSPEWMQLQATYFDFCLQALDQIP